MSTASENLMTCAALVAAQGFAPNRPPRKNFVCKRAELG